MQMKHPVILALICALCFTTTLTAQDATQETTEKAKVQKQDRKKNKGAEKKKARLVQKITKELSAVELTEDQGKKLAELVGENFKALQGFQKKIDGFIGKDERKTMNAAVKKARGEGIKWPDAMKAAYKEIGLSEEDQASVVSLNKERNELTDKIKKEIAATFSEDQKKAMAEANEKKKGKGKGKKDKKDKTETTSVSVSLPGMT